ncbi:AbrB/MazE/SpoVT family DNA-binding domain-containing protein [Paenibacillus farraposensis]|uniref:AbrB/MazE/SpoVT family DNA-binding domain-containing protein n=1 Tax=Paenibacillus farraposensis TaxID=2807095 RepID=A0ABW4DH50_9BACL|nr:AbrB/MazE/SpoVT family DNA-binding domain-containing protein [Paenibacillus farraposensis]
MSDALMTRNLDSLGRIVIPIEIRRRLGINNDTPMEFFITENSIVMYRVGNEQCLLCGGTKQLIQHKNSYVCIYCANSLKGSPIPEAHLPSTTGDIQNASDAQMVKLLLDLMKQYPGASMKTYAKLMEISPTYAYFLEQNSCKKCFSNF